ncbi:permease prefix domain 1-containing protein [Metabacillus sp. cB07]|uniref:permease prefix domain 1-containing protein n=1 Tax=Metabacillus sp. cB07 TaxID=2806989 RepID=UPI0019395ED9|nr:permease prefix domain 1-containing protein [Metabacillus sp. cB07]
MKQIEKYVTSIYKDVSGNRQEIEDLMQEMRSHLMESVQELKAEGHSEDAAVRIAIENFGGKQHIVKGLSEFFHVQKTFLRYLKTIAVLAFVLGCIFLVFSIMEQNEFNNELKQMDFVGEDKERMMEDVYEVIQNSSELSPADEEKLTGVYDKYENRLNLIAVFPVKGLEDWLQENMQALQEPVNHFPIDYERAAAVIGSEGTIEDKAEIKPSDYDYGTVVKANDKWIVQYEYKTSYESVIEKQLQMENYGPSLLDFYKFPLFFFTIAIILWALWASLGRHTKRLQETIS